MRLVILDRDGVINKDSSAYIKAPEEWEPLPGSLEAVARLCRAEYRVVVATNQSGIARGLFDPDALSRIHDKMLERVRHIGGRIDAIFFCPHGPEDGCECRKPAPGMFLEIAARLKTKLTGVPVVGDSPRDIEAARAVDALPVLVRSGKDVAAGTVPAEVPVFDDLAGFTDALLAGRLKKQIARLVKQSSARPPQG